MEFTFKRTVQVIAILLLGAAAIQAIYTVLYKFQPDIDRHFLWGIEAVLFTILAAFAGSALVQSKRFTLGFSAIMVSAAINIVQVGIGLTMFSAFREAAGNVEGLAPAAGGVVAFSFMVYNAAKVLLALAAIVFGMGKMNAGSKALGGLTALVGTVALVANALSMALGYGFSGDLKIAGGSGVLATILLALCLFTMTKED